MLVVWFSRAGENYHNGGRRDLTVGNTQVLTGMIGDRLVCDTYEIVAADPYPEGYDATVERNRQEQDDDARPRISNPLPDLDPYDTVILASPIWNVRPPMIMTTLAEQLDFTGITVIPVTTHAMSGLGQAERDYSAVCRGATLAEGLAVRGKRSPRPAPRWTSGWPVPAWSRPEANKINNKEK